MTDFNVARLHDQHFYSSLAVDNAIDLAHVLSEVNALNFIANAPLVKVHSISHFSYHDSEVVVLEVAGSAIRRALMNDLPGKGQVAEAIVKLTEQIKVVHDAMRQD